MAYEKSWQFLAPQGPNVSVSAADSVARWMWTVKSFLTGQIGGATQGLWTVAGSNDGSTFSMTDGVDRWTTTYDLAKIPYSDTSGTKGWIILTRTFGIQQIWLVLGAGTAVTGNAYVSYLGGSAPTGGNTTTIPTMSIVLGGHLISDGLKGDWVTNTTNGRRFYGAISTTGDFWMAETIMGELATGTTFHVPVGTKANDQWPYFYYHCVPYTAGSYVPFAGHSLYDTYQSGNSNVTRLYNGSPGLWFLPAPPNTILTDASDVSLFDYPAWLLVGDSNYYTKLHARGRLADCGLCSGRITSVPSDSRPVPIGTTIRDINNNIVYVVMNQFILPYNALVM